MIKRAYLLILFAAVCLITIIVNSCKKDSHLARQNAITDPAIAAAKNWYESKYPTGNTRLTTQATTSNADLSQLITPDWEHTASYTRFNKPVIEIPINPSSKFSSAIKNMTSGRGSNPSYSRSSFILLNNGSGYDAYIMTLIADSGYIKGDPGKLDHDKYNKRDADYSGLLLYFTPKGEYVAGYKYKDGKLVLPASIGTSPGVKVLSKGDSKLKPMYQEPICYDYWLVGYTNGVEDSRTYLFTACEPGGDDDGDPAGGDPSGGSPAGGGIPSYNSPTPPPPCANQGPAPKSNSTNSVGVNNVPPDPTDPGDGYQPPPPHTTPCEVPIPAPDIIDSLSIKYPCAKALINSLPNLNSKIAQLIYQAFDSKDGNNIIFLAGDAIHFTANSKLDGYTNFDNSNGILTNKIYINPAVLANSSNEYRIATLYHEAIHAFLNSELNTLKQAGFAAKYPMVNIVERQNLSQVVGADKYDYYIDPAYQMKVVGKDHLTMAEYFIDDLKDAILAYNPNFPPERALALAQTGIIQNNTSSSSSLNNAERDVTKGKSVGTKCTP